MAGYLLLPDGSRMAVHDGLTLGRGTECEIVLDDRKASRHHAQLVVNGSVVEIEDLDSRNGTLLNGKPVRRRLLRDGDEILIGTTALRFVDAAEPAPAPAPRADPMAGDPYRPGGGLEGDPLAALEPRAAGDEFEILEFVDEVVEVKRRPEPALPPPACAPQPGPKPAAPGREHGVLQFSKHARGGGLLRDDLRQMPVLVRAVLVVVVLALAVGLGYLAMRVVGG